ncbi:MAG: retroviral-like aspartic protease family protein [Methylotenera sp.]|jgi:tetratricopeptide (TPR) repeat protein|nr:retroviral-like aspartic protease family protein [Methylotenera sp.]
MTSRTITAAAAFVLALGTFSSAWAACRLGHLEMPVRIVNQRPVTVLKLNGADVTMLVDSGAFFSLLQPATAAQLGLKLMRMPDHIRVTGYTGAIEAKLTRVEKVGLQGSTLQNVEFIVGGNELGSGIQGVLGRNFLSMADTEYDLGHGVLRLVFPKGDCEQLNLAHWAGDAPVIEAELRNNHREGNTDIRVPVRVNDRPLVAVMDTGAPFSALKLRSARRAGVTDAMLTPVGRVGGAGEGRVQSWRASIAAFEFGGEKIANNEFQVDDTDHFEQDMLIGLDYFLSHRIYVSRLQRKVYATWNGGPVFARGDAVGSYDERYAARPADLADDAEALARRGEARAAKGDAAGALADLDRAIELAPNAAANRLARARVLLDRRQRDKAAPDLDEALRLQPSLHEARALRVGLRLRADDKAGAQADLQVLDEALPASSHLREIMADQYTALAMVPQALRQWEMWVASHGSDAHLAQVLNGRCWLRARLKLDLPLALEDCRRAVRLDGQEASYRDSLGWVYLQSGDLAAAVKAFDDALALRPVAFSHYGRALARQRQGDAAAARRDLAAARELRPEIDAQARLEGLPVADDAPPP